jgi:predicted nucleotidyltransferase
MSVGTSQIHEEVLRDPRYPVHRIADQLLPYLKVLVEEFHPEQVILFGSYAYGHPDRHSDVDLLVVKEMQQSSLSARRDILKAWRPLRWSGESLPFELMVVTPSEHRDRIAHGGGFYSTITSQGLLLA